MPVSAHNSFLMVILLFLCLGYIIQSGCAGAKAHVTNLLHKIFHPRKLIDTWGTVSLMLFIPLMISFVSGFSMIEIAPIYSPVVELVLSMLLVLITLEVSIIGSLNEKNNHWRTLLIVALMLDIFAIVLVVIYKKINVDLIGSIYAIGVLSFVSSFAIVLFAFVAGKEHD